MTENSRTLLRFMEQAWNAGDVSQIERFVAEQYTIFSDPGDPWDGRTLSRAEFVERLLASRAPFPDLRFDVAEMVPEGDRVAISWTMRGTQRGPMGDRPPSGRAISAHGMTIYYFLDGLLVGHRQVVDRLTVARQLGLAG
jgi:steroid delta-isomerase-like uncharacterized protein